MKNKTKTRSLSIWWKIVLPTSLLILVLCILFGIMSYRQIRTGMVEMGVEEARMAADIAITMIDGDLVDSIRPGSVSYGDPEYMEMLASLKEIQSTCGIEFIYTLYSDDKTNLYYGVSNDDTATDSTFGTSFGDPYSEFADVYAGNGYVQDYIDQTEFGNLISAYLPIYDSNGKVVGILGCDYEATNVVDRIRTAISRVISISFFMLVLSIILLGLIVRGITRNLHKVDDKIYDLVNSDGDLTKKLDIATGDELELISDNINSLLSYIREIMTNISHNSKLLEESTSAVVGSLSDANSGITGVSAKIEEMSAAMQETSASLCDVDETIAAIVSTIVSIADKAVSQSRSSDQISGKVQDIYNRAVSDKETAARQAAEMSKVVNEKIECSKAVEQINALTDEIINITDQTSLLSLNASIEAARAGEAGRGFAVVANEIGSLAANSAKAAEQIQHVSSEVVIAVNDLAKEAEKMIHFMNETAMAGYDKLLDNSTDYRNDVKNLSLTMQGFATDSEDLRVKIESIKESVGEINIAVEESAKALVNVAGITVDLSKNVESINNEADANMLVAEELSNEVGKFKL